MGLYLAELARPSEYETDPIEVGHLLVHYKRELRWAKPCMRFGAFEVPDLAWVKRNYARYKVWIDFEDQRVALKTQESLIWVGFHPVGGENAPEPAAVATDYPETLVEEIGSWRVVRQSKAGLEKLQIFQLDPDGTPHAVLEADGKSSITLLQESCTILAPEGATINAAKGCVLSTPEGDIELGAGADEPALCGNLWLEKMTNAFTEVLKANVVTAMGPSSPISGGPASLGIQPAVDAFQEVLSEFVFIRKARA